jgi:hypothetical protein
MTAASDDLSHPAAIRRWTWRICLWTLTLAVTAAALAAALHGPEQALSVLLGAALGALNFLALARAALRFLGDSRPSAADPDAAPPVRSAPLLATLRWPATALATAAILWYMPGRPEGLVAGVLIALVALAVTALQLQPADEPPER